VPPPNTFAGARLDRAGERRTDDAWLAERAGDPASRAVVVTEEGALVADTPGDGTQPVRLPLTQVEGELVLLGLEGDTALFAAHRATQAPPDARTIGLREAGALLEQHDGGLIAYAAGMLNWHRRHPHCSVCGARTELAEAGHVRRCPNCGAVHHPRTDPVVIMLVTDADRVLLGRQPTWPPGRYSTLAGFVEPGESLEEAVAREVAEEAGVEVANIRYQSSQPWPFPASLMLGFTAEYTGGEAAVRDRELDDVRWFDRDALRAAATWGAAEGELHLPPPLAIARRLIDGWLESA
jgi:NAD+ diphosphatase